MTTRARYYELHQLARWHRRCTTNGYDADAIMRKVANDAAAALQVFCDRRGRP